MREFVRTTLWWVALAFVGDSLVAPMITIGNVAPDFSIIALVVLALLTLVRMALLFQMRFAWCN